VALAIGAWALVASWGMPVTGPEGRLSGSSWNFGGDLLD